MEAAGEGERRGEEGECWGGGGGHGGLDMHAYDLLTISRHGGEERLE